MANECPKCKTENTHDSQFCKKCANPLPESKEGVFTKTIETPTEELTTGSTFAGRYQIIEELGKGGMGKVYKAVDKKIKEKIALKLIKPEISSDKKTVERFSNELKLARKIRHHNVCQMFDIGEEKGTHFITMEYIHGEDLRRLIRKVGNLSPAQAISIAKQVCEGLSEAHRLGIVHRDLKPQNIMVDEDGNARIMDFGIARSIRTKGITGSGIMIGTPEYMSPEQIESKDVDQRSDIYSLGIILFEMVTGRVPFEGDSPFTVGMKHKSEEPPAPQTYNPRIPDDLSTVILRCLEKDKEKRYQSAGEVRSALESIEKEIPTTEREVPKRKPLTSKEITVSFNIKKVFIPSLVVLGLVLAAVVVWRVLLYKKRPIFPQQKQSIAIISFENQTGDVQFDHLSKIIPNLLITSLEQSGYFDVMSWERMRDILRQLGRKDVEFVDRDLGFELCRQEGINTIVLGSYGKAGDMFATDVKVLDVETKNLLKSASANGEGEGSIIRTQIDELSKEISQGTGLSERLVDKNSVNIADSTTNSIEAYDYFLKGRRADEKFYYIEALEYFEKAVEIDPNFVGAYLWINFQHRSLGDNESADKALKRAWILSENTNKKERLYIEIAYAFWIEGDSEQGIELLEKMTKEFPKEKGAHFWLSINYGARNLFDQSIEEMEKVLALDPEYANALNMMAYTYMDLEEYDKALEYFNRYEAVLPDDPNPKDSIAELFLHMGRLDEALSKYEKVLEIKPDFYSRESMAYIYALKEQYSEAVKWIKEHISMVPSPVMKAEGYLWKGYYHHVMGIWDQSLDDIQQAKVLAEAGGNERRKARADWLLGWIYYDREEYDLSREHIKQWFEAYVKSRPLMETDYSIEHNFLLGLIDLQEGMIDEAKMRLDEIKTALPESEYSDEMGEFITNFLGAEIFLVEGALDKTLSLCQKQTIPSLPTWSNPIDIIANNIPFMRDTLARVYVKKGEMDKAINAYEVLITFKSESRERRLVHPKLHYRLAKLYEQKGWEGKAIEHYEKFLDLWKDADPGLPEVEDAKARLAGL